MKKMGLSVKKFFSVFNQQKFALPEKYFEEKRFLFRKSFLFLLSFLEFEWCLCLIAKLFSQVCQITDHCAERKYWEKEPWKFVFFYSIFGLWAEKTWTFNKTVRHDSQKRSLSVQMNFYRKFSGSKNFCMNVFGQWTEISDFRRKWFLRVFKGAVHVSSATLWGKDDKSKLYILWLVWDFVGFLLLWGQKASQGCQNDKLSVQSKT